MCAVYLDEKHKDLLIFNFLRLFVYNIRANRIVVIIVTRKKIIENIEMCIRTVFICYFVSVKVSG